MKKEPRAYGFWKLAEQNPSNVVLVDEREREWSAHAMLSACNRLVHALRARGMSGGDVLAVALPDSAEFLQLYLAALQAGFYFVPLSPVSTDSELAYIVGDCRAAVLVHDRDESSAMERESTLVVSLEQLLVESSKEPDTTPIDRATGAPLFYTSGTTGEPKAVLKPLPGTCPDRLGRFAAVHLNAVCGIRPRSGAIHLVVSPLYHSASLLWCADHLHLGHKVVLAGSWDSEKTLTLIERFGVTGSLMVPTHFYRLLQLPDSDRERFEPGSLQHVVHTGAPCPITIKKKMMDWWGPVIFEVYGAAEGGGTRVTPGEWLSKPGTVGRSFGRILILDEQGVECERGTTGTVYIKLGPGAFSYGNAPEKTDRSQHEGYFSVGDLGYLDQEDYLYLQGRRSSVILTGGVNVYPAEVEAVLLSHPRVADAVVLGVPDEEFGERVKAVIEPVGDDRSLEEELRLLVRRELAPYKCPKSYQWVDRMPRNSAGKISYQVLGRFHR